MKNRLLKPLEEKIGDLSCAQRALLTTDGSVTALLEAFERSTIEILTDHQEIHPAGVADADLLAVSPGDPVNFREVLIRASITKKPLIYAISRSAVERMPGYAMDELTRADRPIGHILRDATLESRRELISISTENDKHDIAVKLGSHPKLPLLTRSYRIISNQKPLFHITEYLSPSLYADQRVVHVKTPSRLHLGLIDLNGTTGRIDGGVGITLADPGLHLSARMAEEWSVNGAGPALTKKIEGIFRRIQTDIPVIPGAAITVHDYIPDHEGLGSGTQTALAICSAVMELYGIRADQTTLARITGRGGTSGIGLQSFIQGGVIVDGGHSFGPGKQKETYLPSSASVSTPPAPVLGRYPFPESWKVILACPRSGCQISGEREKDIFTRYCPVPIEEVRATAHAVLMGLIPSVIEEDLDGFDTALRTIQQNGFKAREIALQPEPIRETLRFMQDGGLGAAGMSSFGPTLFLITDTGERKAAESIDSFLSEAGGGYTRITTGQNEGASVIPIS